MNDPMSLSLLELAIALNDAQAYLDYLATKPLGWEHFIERSQKRLLACQHALAMHGIVRGQETILMQGTSANGQITVVPVHPSLVSLYETQGFKRAQADATS
jgi:hypothetical protein